MPPMPAPLSGGLDARRVSVVLVRGGSVQRGAGVRPHGRRQTGQAERARAGALLGPAAGAARPSADPGRGRYAADRLPRARLGARAAAGVLSRTSARTRPAAGAIASPRWRVSQVEDRESTIGTVGDDALAISFAAYAARAGLRSVGLVDADLDPRTRDAMEAVGGKGGGGAFGRRTLAAAGRRRALAGLAHRSRIGRRRRSAATRWRSRATAPSPTRSPSSCATPRPTS